MVSQCASLYESRAKRLALLRFSFDFFFTNSSYRDVRQAGIVATMFHANEIEKVKKTLV